MTLTNLDMSHRPGERGRAVWSFQSEYRSRALNHQRSPDKCRQKKNYLHSLAYHDYNFQNLIVRLSLSFNLKFYKSLSRAF